MTDFIERDKLLGDNYHAVVLCEYSKEVNLLKRLIEISEEAVSKRRPKKNWTFEDVCYLFAKDIVSYSKMAYDNFVLGHFHVTNMINRVVIENLVCLDVIFNDGKEELWKYYLVQSYRNSIIKPQEGLRKRDISFLETMYRDYQISPEFYQKELRILPNGKNAKRAYIEEDYGWSYKVNNALNFRGLCDLVNKSDYLDFKMMSDYSHGTAIYLKIGGFCSIDHVMSMISSMYIALYRMVTMYCWGEVEDEFDGISESIEDIIYKYIEESDKLFASDLIE